MTAAQIPLTSLADDIVVTRNLLTAQKGPTVLAGRSYAGVVICGAANDAPNVKALVYIAAFGLDEGESIDALSKQGPAPAGAAAVRPPDENGFLWIDQDGFAKAFAADADPVEARVMAAVQKPLSINSFIAKSGPPAWKHLPSWYMVAEAAAAIKNNRRIFVRDGLLDIALDDAFAEMNRAGNVTSGPF